MLRTPIIESTRASSLARRHLSAGRLAALLAVLGSGFGCDSLTVNRFAGSLVTMQIGGSVPTTPAGQHLELWARDAYGSIIRINDVVDQYRFYGYKIRALVSLSDPCMIDSEGHLLTSPDAYHGTSVGSVTQTPQEQAQQVTDRIRQLTSSQNGGQQSSDLLGIVPWDETPLPTLDASASAGDRLAACNAYWAASPYAYTPNPANLVAPQHGYFVAFMDWSSRVPAEAIDGGSFTTPVDLTGILELWFTTESVPPDQVDPLKRGPVFMLGTSLPGGRDVINFQLHGSGAFSGTAAVSSQQQDSSWF